jgi:hypothetical protein
MHIKTTDLLEIKNKAFVYSVDEAALSFLRKVQTQTFSLSVDVQSSHFFHCRRQLCLRGRDSSQSTLESHPTPNFHPTLRRLNQN